MIEQVEASAAAPRLDGHWSVVTGGSKGIGLGIAKELARAGSNVVLVARDERALEAGRRDVAEASPDVEVHTRSADMAHTDEIDALFGELDEFVDHLDVFVANAGWGAVRPFLEIPLEEWEQTLALNLTGVFRSCQLAARRMANGPTSRDRSILVVSSIRAIGARPGRLTYSTTKSGLNQFVRVVALELAEHRIRVNALSPGITATPMAMEQNPAVLAELGPSVPLGRAGLPEDMAAAALYLCSPMARYVTGTNLVVDGGESLTS